FALLAPRFRYGARKKKRPTRVAAADRSAAPPPPPPVADIFAVYPERENLSAKVSAFIDFLTEWFGKAAPWPRERR
ncbi:MAG: hypothetical protein ACTHNO_14930, partial [Ralstonia sp.]